MIIGLSGYARSGKDTVAGMLMGLHGYDNRSFAKPIKDALYNLNPFVGPNLTVQHVVDANGWEASKVQYPELRRLLQVFGTEIGREMFYEDIWVDIAFKGILPHHKIVFTDVRYENEANFIKVLEGQVWRIDRLGINAVNSHQSESSMDSYPFDKILHNSGTLDDLKHQIAVALLG